MPIFILVFVSKAHLAKIQKLCNNQVKPNFSGFLFQPLSFLQCSSFHCEDHIYFHVFIRRFMPGGGGYSIYPSVGRCGSVPHTLTLIKTKIADFPTLFKTEF